MEKDVNLFFACDDNYIPCLSVVFKSMKNYINEDRDYKIKVMHGGNICKENQERIIKAYYATNFEIEFVDVSSYIENICELLHTRDYYSKSTYFRLFIPKMYPQLTKALYLDSDIVLLDDVAKLYDVDIDDYYVGAIPDEAVAMVPEFREYVENRIGVKKYSEYFNAGILLMNLEKLRSINFEDLFVDLLQAVKYNVAQDQDYLNAICLNNVKYIDLCWNKMPLPNDEIKEEELKLIHYNLSYKPWHSDDILYSDYFWNFANYSEYSREIRSIRQNYTREMSLNCEAQSINLIKMAKAQAEDENANKEILKIVETMKLKHVGKV